MIKYKNFFLTFLLIAAPLMIGSIHFWSITICLAISIIIFTFELIDRGIAEKSPDAGPFGWILITLCLFTLIQMLPLPASLVKILSPLSWEIQSELYSSLLHTSPPQFLTLSLDRYSTLCELMKLSSGVFLFLAIRHRVRHEGSNDVLWCVAWSGIGVCVVFFVHKLAGWQKVYEFYTPVYAPTTPLSAPLLNANHLAGSLGLSAAVAVGLGFSEKNTVKKLLLIFVAGFTGAGVLLTLSRGGILAFIGGQLLFIALRLAAKKQTSSKWGKMDTKFLPLALAIAIFFGFYVAYGSILKEFLEGDASKVKVATDSIPLIKDFWLTGVGRGSFQFGYTLVQKLLDTSTYMYPENFIAQYISEWGIPIGGIFIISLLTLIVLGLLKPPKRARNAGALCAIFALLVQNLVDFGLEILGVFLPFVVILASTIVMIENAYGLARIQNAKGEIERKFRLPGQIGILVVISALVLLVIGCYLCSRFITDRETNMIKSALKNNADVEKFLPLVNGSMKRHPADYYYPLIAGIKLYHTNTSNPLPYFGRAITLFPNCSTAHLYVARTLGRKKLIGQSLLEYMYAARSSPAIANKVAEEVVRLTLSFEEADKMTRNDADRFLIYEPLSLAFSFAGLDSEAEKADDALLSIDPFKEGPALRKGLRLLERGKIEEATAIAERLKTNSLTKRASLELRGKIERKKGNLKAAAKMFLSALQIEPSRRDLLLEAASCYANLGDKENLFKILERYEISASDEAAKGHAIMTRANFESGLKMYDRAMASYLAAAALLHDEPTIWESVASLAEMKKDTSTQLKALQELSRLEPENPKWKEKIKEIENRLNALTIE